MELTQQRNEIENLLDNCSHMNIYLIEKPKGRNTDYKVYLFPNDATDEALLDYKNNFKNYVSKREIVDYSKTDAKKETIQKLSVDDLPQWKKIRDLIDNVPTTNAPIFKESNVSKDIKMVIIECKNSDGKPYVYLISKFSHKTTYSNKVLFFFTGSVYKKMNHSILTLGDCIDCFVFNDEVYILLENRFNSMFDFYKRIKDEVNNKISEIESWDFFDDNDISNEILDKPRKSLQFLKVISSESLTKWKEMSISARKDFIKKDEKLKDKFQFDNDNKIIRTKNSVIELFKLLNCEYYRNILTGETEER